MVSRIHVVFRYICWRCSSRRQLLFSSPLLLRRAFAIVFLLNLFVDDIAIRIDECKHIMTKLVEIPSTGNDFLVLRGSNLVFRIIVQIFVAFASVVFLHLFVRILNSDIFGIISILLPPSAFPTSILLQTHREPPSPLHIQREQIIVKHRLYFVMIALVVHHPSEHQHFISVQYRGRPSTCRGILALATNSLPRRRGRAAATLARHQRFQR
mmetsp:Transcript_18478/g.40166  ORF Transcript_18478/g.40166 Transcript_18478/m.40166 type:complete len:211 (-) Transcript_18478:351-983(-)